MRNSLSEQAGQRKYEEQKAKYQPTIGRGLQLASIKDLSAACDQGELVLSPWYTEDEQKFVWHERLRLKLSNGEDGNTLVKDLVDKWTSEPSNIERAEATSNRKLKRSATGEALRAYGLFRLRAHEAWGNVIPHARFEEDGPQQTLIVIALNELSLANGWFMTLEQGQDVAIDVEAGEIILPPAGGGLSVMFWLRI